jgi:hypothetical protein
MDTDTILCPYHLNYVVRSPGLRPFLFHAEFHHPFVRVDYLVRTTCVMEELLEKGVVAAGVIAHIMF